MRPPDATVFVVDDHGGLRRSLRFLLESAGLQTEGYASAEAFLAGYRPSRVGCLIVDVQMPGMTGVQLLEALAEKGDFRPAVVITGHGDVGTAVRAMKAGAVDFLEKPFDDQDLLDRVQTCIELDAQWRRWRCEAVDVVERLATLTPREREVMDQVVAGRHTREIAGALGLSPSTVEHHRHSVMQKMEARSSVDLTRMALACRKLAGPP
ncbi:MAG: response regulator transcription factor [Rhodospirillales bacterium]